MPPITASSVSKLSPRERVTLATHVGTMALHQRQLTPSLSNRTVPAGGGLFAASDRARIRNRTLVKILNTPEAVNLVSCPQTVSRPPDEAPAPSYAPPVVAAERDVFDVGNRRPETPAALVTPAQIAPGGRTMPLRQIRKARNACTPGSPSIRRSASSDSGLSFLERLRRIRDGPSVEEQPLPSLVSIESADPSSPKDEAPNVIEVSDSSSSGASDEATEDDSDFRTPSEFSWQSEDFEDFITTSDVAWVAGSEAYDAHKEKEQERAGGVEVDDEDHDHDEVMGGAEDDAFSEEAEGGGVDREEANLEGDVLPFAPSSSPQFISARLRREVYRIKVPVSPRALRGVRAHDPEFPERTRLGQFLDLVNAGGGISIRQTRELLRQCIECDKYLFCESLGNHHCDTRIKLVTKAPTFNIMDALYNSGSPIGLTKKQLLKLLAKCGDCDHVVLAENLTGILHTCRRR
ncbi:hypothetical protein FA15DRAFT_653782 [Coprinopsis marcescibilis]|uniref:Uncharacterized protein n=1 Tax=Coprinopsis marcescibilis TaxID=230819 RepID=A0A5C3L296_COPMA|nr:hypothetical protein FA15DRAFT_653782 [Coprinopsis marcescibilis]